MANQPQSQRPWVLVASDDDPYAGAVTSQLETDGYHVDRCQDVAGLLRAVGQHDYDVLLLDMEVAFQSDMDLVSFILRRSPLTQIILIYEIARMERAIEGIRQGAFFHLPKSSMPSDVALVVAKAVRALQNEHTVRQYEQSVLKDIAGASPAMQRVIQMITKVAPTDSTVLLIGESGTGKEVLAGTIHRISNRKNKPFIAVNCAALPEALLESELFGHIKGAFTGADADKRGLFEEADGGTFFLDEIGDMALPTQAKLLRVLQSGEIRPVGSSVTKRVDVRIIAATNKDLVEAVANHEFREDLYFRLNVIQIRVPPLRQRKEALPGLIHHFLQRYNREYGRNVTSFDERAQVMLMEYAYPGNVRELESIIAHAVIMADDTVIRPEDLPEQLHNDEYYGRLALPNLHIPVDGDDIPTLQQVERDLIEKAMKRLDNNQTEAAKRLGISRSTLWRKIKEYGINT